MSSHSLPTNVAQNFVPGKFFRLMDLPQEIRLHIWSVVLCIEEGEQVRTIHFVSNVGHITTPYCQQHLGRNRAAVLQVNRQIYFEARGVLYGLRQFSIGINQMSCIGNGSKPFTSLSCQAIPATWNVRFREHLYLMTKLNVYIHLDKAVLRGSDANALADADNTISEAISAAILRADLSSNPTSTNLSLHQMLQMHNGNAAVLQLPNMLIAAANPNAHFHQAANLGANPTFNFLANVAPNTAANGAANINGAVGPSLSTLSALEYQKMDNVMVVKAALEELCHVLSMCGKLKDLNVIYIDTLGDFSPARLGFNVLHPFKNLARSVRCRVCYVPIQGNLDRPLQRDADSSKMEGAIFVHDTTLRDTLYHLKAISLVSNVKLTPRCIAEVNRRLM